jgi:hypothetical protein
MTVSFDISIFFINCHHDGPPLYMNSYTILKNSWLPFIFILSTSSPQLTTLASCKGRHIRSTGRPSTCDTTSCPDSTCPNTTCTLQQDVKKQVERTSCIMLLHINMFIKLKIWMQCYSKFYSAISVHNIGKYVCILNVIQVMCEL